MTERPVSAYQSWMRREGIPIVEGHGVQDIRDLKLMPWDRLGAEGTFIDLHGMEGFTGMYTARIPGKAALNWQRHLFEKVIYVIEGDGILEVSSPYDERTVSVEWHAGSILSPPLNAWHRLYNRSAGAAVLLAVTTAPPIMDLLRDDEFIFNCDHAFADRFDGREDYFRRPDNRYRNYRGGSEIWETNFVPNGPEAALRRRVHGANSQGGGFTLLQMADNTLACHIKELPAGNYNRAHWHGGGAILLSMRSHGYTLMWPRELGTRPFESGHGDQVVRVDWATGGLCSPGTGWFHQHFNTGEEPCRQLAFRYCEFGSYPLGIWNAFVKHEQGVNVSIRDGGSLIPAEDEDPSIGSEFDDEIARRAHVKDSGVQA